MVLNLRNIENSDLNYKKISYPDGQVSLIIDDIYDVSDQITIKTSINSYDDLMYLLAATDVIKHNVPNCKINLEIVQLLGGRSDHRPFETQSSDLAIICKIIKASEYESINLFHPHSQVSTALLDASVKNNEQLIRFMMRFVKEPFVFVSPDAGAYKNTFKLGEKFKIPVLAANKFRDENGVKIHLHSPVQDLNCVIIDDYCDGGATFIELAKLLKNAGAKTVRLCVSHFLGSKGIEPILEHIDEIYTTNSIREIDHERIEQLKVI